MDTIRNPIEWSGEQVAHATGFLSSVARALRGPEEAVARPGIRTLSRDDLFNSFSQGWEDVKAMRSDVIALCIVYPLIGAFLTAVAVDQARITLIFPMAAGFALLGPVVAIGLYEMSRRRESGRETRLVHALGVLGSPSAGAMFLMGLGLLALYILWLVCSEILFQLTLGPEQPASATAFFMDATASVEGWAMILGGIGLGFLFALAALVTASISFPLLLDRDVGIRVAIETSLRVFAQNPSTMLFWGFLVAGTLVGASIPAFVGFIFALPLLGHATWHLYRRAVEWPETDGA